MEILERSVSDATECDGSATTGRGREFAERSERSSVGSVAGWSRFDRGVRSLMIEKSDPPYHTKLWSSFHRNVI
jgi:hypothetical protein